MLTVSVPLEGAAAEEEEDVRRERAACERAVADLSADLLRMQQVCMDVCVSVCVSICLCLSVFLCLCLYVGLCVL